MGHERIRENRGFMKGHEESMALSRGKDARAKHDLSVEGTNTQKHNIGRDDHVDLAQLPSLLHNPHAATFKNPMPSPSQQP